MTVRYRLGCDLSYEVLEPTTFIFNLEVARLMRHQQLTERLIITPDLKRRTHVVPDINNRYLSIDASPGPLHLSYEAEVTLDVFRADPETIDETPLSELPLDIVPFLLPSRFVPSDRLAAFANREFGAMPGGHRRVTAICNWIHENIDYRRGASNEQTTADESLLLRAGVCRDFAHIGIAFCRALNIPARFVSCYAYGLEPRDFHAVFEAYMGGRWWLFDATRQANLDGLVRIGVGRDAAEIAFASPFGKMEPGPVKITVEHADGSGEKPGRTTDAISTEEPAPNAGAQ
ncbi:MULTISPECIES: transglutaminase-like domain-containing protein [unclassified Rhizobium]|uniref:transglutaminase-like domain-containing protein n=1 Tax=unclassified Rhizobium TaxID=2613769 RepID=UPI001ADC060F|nr:MULTISPECIES: transglutaminase family protein [unclassified Rhizobium]MBO9099158.1 transglutaminase family protein [Rhizobium sp. L58/93]MBO9132036.1 transglutaminase family protein [Rhizobium sp. B209b/85]MBO9169420.1 transglutaminase family protein [Rhizobium sp. L245/93]MBO9185371.1 transglutaminase family protein [Rhizobium sp. E27B/91]QXZ85509.1 transglutaminase family protein [Rhizobium sp. K1/93]